MSARRSAAPQPHAQRLGAIAAAAASVAAQVYVGEELHLDMLEAVAAAHRAAPGTTVETEGAGRVPVQPGVRAGREQRADLVEGADVAHRVRACGATDGFLVDEHRGFDQFGAAQLAVSF